MKRLLTTVYPYCGPAGSLLAAAIFAWKPIWGYFGTLNTEIAAPVFYAISAVQVLAIGGYILARELKMLALILVWLGAGVLFTFVFMSLAISGILFVPVAGLSLAGAAGLSLSKETDRWILAIALGVTGSTLGLILFAWQPIWTYLEVSDLTAVFFMRIGGIMQLLAIAGYILVKEIKKLALILIWSGAALLCLIAFIGLLTIGLFFLPAAVLSFLGARKTSRLSSSRAA